MGGGCSTEDHQPWKCSSKTGAKGPKYICTHMTYILNSLAGCFIRVIQGSIIGVITADTRIFDYSSFIPKQLNDSYVVEGSGSACTRTRSTGLLWMGAGYLK